MKVLVEQLAFGEGEIREVNLPDDCDTSSILSILRWTFHWGQNDFQNVSDRYSVSMGDVVWLQEDKYLIKGTGWSKLDAQEYADYKALPQEQRSSYSFGRGEVGG